MKTLPAVLAFALLWSASSASAACINKYLNKSEGPRQIVTLLTGKLTFQEAQELTKSIASKTAPPIEWVDDKGKTIAKQFGELKVVRPMPVGCDGKTSGVIMIVTFPTGQQPTGKLQIKLDGTNAVAFEQQKD